MSERESAREREEGERKKRVLCSSKRSCESAGSLGKVNLAVADGSKLITTEEL